MNVEIKRQIQHLWFIKELLQKILTIAVTKVFFLENITTWNLQNLSWQVLYELFSTTQLSGCDRIFYRNSCEIWNETIPFLWRYIYMYVCIYTYIYKGIHIKSNCKYLYSIMLIFQIQVYCSENLSVWNYSQEVITKTSEEWNLLKK